MSEVRARAGDGRRSPDRVTRGAGSGRDQRQASGRGGIGRCGRGPGLDRQPRREVFGGVDPHIQRHLGMLQAAELRALAAHPSQPARRDRQMVGPPRDHVDLAAEVGDPERMDHVGRADFDARGPVDRQMQLVGGLDPPPGRGIAVFQPPPPLLRRDPDVGGGGLVLHRQRPIDQEARGRQDQDARRDKYGPGAEAHSQRTVVGPGLRRSRQSMSRPPDRPAQEHQHERIGPATDDQHQVHQSVQGRRLIACRIQHGRTDGAASQHRRQKRQTGPFHHSGPRQVEADGSPVCAFAFRRRWSGFTSTRPWT